ncbi:hypothetical protein [Natronorubrum daqingense]|uniref:Uncharacterized protein n=1 Tax=Natronorubrum daqingense TaxID=588898 RepID=A0A1N7F6D1_9EURY|nr:hypothetical protein [Natronorubrum daqingense]APX97563.1 hypothetical protein BB347_13620 [Natronorubrum daqingense]SIR95812.1 hypothetical protein SAMN05421809_3041 [Natronorubrum daqingense]
MSTEELRGKEDRVRIRFQDPEAGETAIVVTDSQKKMVASAVDRLDTDVSLFINMASKWGNARDPNLPDRITTKHKRRAHRSPKSREQLIADARNKILKTRVLDFAEFVTAENPNPDWNTDGGELSLHGDLEP